MMALNGRFKQTKTACKTKRYNQGVQQLSSTQEKSS
jgi:hypothetical protein